jgi:hypothetical protein
MYVRPKGGVDTFNHFFFAEFELLIDGLDVAFLTYVNRNTIMHTDTQVPYK